MTGFRPYSFSLSECQPVATNTLLKHWDAAKITAQSVAAKTIPAAQPPAEVTAQTSPYIAKHVLTIEVPLSGNARNRHLPKPTHVVAAVAIKIEQARVEMAAGQLLELRLLDTKVHPQEHSDTACLVCKTQCT